jgi:hypothetical protein
MPTPIQFLQTWLPGFVRTMTQARKIDELIGLSIVGNWEDEEVVQGIIEPTGAAVPYGDASNVPLTSWNVNYERRTVLRFEQGIHVGVLEEARAARIKANTAAEKRNAAGLSLDIQRNRVGFLGYNGGANRTYGFLNDPSLPAYKTPPTAPAAPDLGEQDVPGNHRRHSRHGATPAHADRRQHRPGKGQDDAGARNQRHRVPDRVVSASGRVGARWLKNTYPGMTPKSAPELSRPTAARTWPTCTPKSIDDGATDDSRVWAQLVPSKFQTIGVAKLAKGYVEDYSNALAGVMCKRPYAVQRLSGI